MPDEYGASVRSKKRRASQKPVFFDIRLDKIGAFEWSENYTFLTSRPQPRTQFGGHSKVDLDLISRAVPIFSFVATFPARGPRRVRTRGGGSGLRRRRGQVEASETATSTRCRPIEPDLLHCCRPSLPKSPIADYLAFADRPTPGISDRRPLRSNWQIICTSATVFSVGPFTKRQDDRVGEFSEAAAGYSGNVGQNANPMNRDDGADTISITNESGRAAYSLIGSVRREILISYASSHDQVKARRNTRELGRCCFADVASSYA